MTWISWMMIVYGIKKGGVSLTYEQLLYAADRGGLSVKEQPLRFHDGLIRGKRIAIRRDIPTLTQKACVLAEELGHHYTNVGNVLDQTEMANIKQERKARMWAYNKQIGLSGILSAYRYGCRNLHEMAEYLDVTEPFLRDALDAYALKYGKCTVVDNYMIFFEPLGVMDRRW